MRIAYLVGKNRKNLALFGNEIFLLFVFFLEGTPVYP